MKRIVNLANSVKRVKIVEVGARDGLQNEKPLSISKRIDFINRLTDCGFKQIETGSLVKLKSMENSDQVFKQINKKNRIEYPLLVLNNKGAEIAKDLGAKYISLGISPSNEFCKKNMGKEFCMVLKEVKKIINTAKNGNMKVRGYISTIANCPYEGDIDPEKVSKLTKLLLDLGCYEISLGDTTGKATQKNMESIINSIKSKNLPVNKLAGHFHDTYDLALGNVLVSLNHGITTFDSSIAGLGGCPFAPGSSGNLATEKLIKFLNKIKITTDLNIDNINKTSEYISQILGKEKYILK